ncbi:ABC-2 family transporter protein [Arthrobacter sp. ISL-48]|uniref:ABC transporter permease n=1 Tax=Arthrobacter sp. ISL-48 TaxID=2819110 RepID=UPI001BE82F84|nr:ABC-2 family transporter protein [Arthrobacter sp. ISL-48]MBT2532660.1 ABC-2 family transporter protein [Arthrobacter sp. ISL-48]
MRAYWELAKSSFRRNSTYRLAAFSGAFTNSVFGLIRASLLLSAISTAGGTIGGYSAVEAATYVWLGQALLAPLGLFGSAELAGRVKSGDIAVDLSRSVNLTASYWAQDVGRAAFDILPRGVPPLVIGALVTGLSLPTTAGPYVLGFVSVLAALTLSFLGFFVINLLSFWVVEIRGYWMLYLVLMNLLSGFLVPVTWFPQWMLDFARATPFPSMLQTPVDILAGRTDGALSLALVGVQLLWLAVLLAGTQLMVRYGSRKLVVQGG